MTVINHFVDKDGTLKLTLDTGQICTVPQVLATRATELHTYIHNHMDSTHIEAKKHSAAPINMIFSEYVEVGHVEAAIELISLAISSYQQPSTQVILILTDLLLKRVKVTSRRHRKQLAREKALVHQVLIRTLQRFGPRSLSCLWAMFGAYQQSTFDAVDAAAAKKKRGRPKKAPAPPPTAMVITIDEDTDEEDEQEDEVDWDVDYGKRLSRFVDFKHMAQLCLEVKNTKLSLSEWGKRLLFDVMMKLLVMDMRLKQNKLADSMFLASIATDSLGLRTRFEPYLAMIVEAFSSTDAQHPAIHTENVDYATQILNMLITLALSGNELVRGTYLLEQTYQAFMAVDDMEVLQQLLRAVQYPLFILQLCDMFLLDEKHCNAESYKRVRLPRGRMTAAVLQDHVFKIEARPLSAYNVWRLCIMVSWLWRAFMQQTSLRIDLAHTASQVVNIRPPKPAIAAQSLIDWKQHLSNQLHRASSDHKHVWVERIDQVVDAMVATIE
ncbi:hypothetical protein BC940DRAFT_298364 [Gongronella butleri]|nr:hypothetical protein BC940DRAFT_298364 [Gongronella butleri]